MNKIMRYLGGNKYDCFISKFMKEKVDRFQFILWLFFFIERYFSLNIKVEVFYYFLFGSFYILLKVWC